jgi:hypothetical protein
MIAVTPYLLFTKAKLKESIKVKKKPRKTQKREEVKRRHYGTILLPSGVSW